MKTQNNNQTKRTSESEYNIADASTRNSGILIQNHPKLTVPILFFIYNKGKSPPGFSYCPGSRSWLHTDWNSEATKSIRTKDAENMIRKNKQIIITTEYSQP